MTELATQPVQQAARPALPKCPTHPQFSILPGATCPTCDWDPASVPVKSADESAVEVVEPSSGEVMVTETFEGADVVEWEMKLPGTVVECDRSFKRGSVIRMAVEVRIRNVGYVERKNGTLTRIHQATLEDISVISAFDPSANHENVGGGLAGTAPDEEDDGEDLLSGMETGRTQQTWPPTPEL